MTGVFKFLLVLTFQPPKWMILYGVGEGVACQTGRVLCNLEKLFLYYSIISYSHNLKRTYFQHTNQRRPTSGRAESCRFSISYSQGSVGTQSWSQGALSQFGSICISSWQSAPMPGDMETWVTSQVYVLDLETNHLLAGWEAQKGSNFVK